MASRAPASCLARRTAARPGRSTGCPKAPAISTQSPAASGALHLTSSVSRAPGRRRARIGEQAMAEDTGNSMKQRLAAGELVLCMNLRLARTVGIAMVAEAGGYDALYVDMQHAPYSIETTSTICAAALGIGITPLVRVPSHDGQWMSRVLDGGAQGD